MKNLYLLPTQNNNSKLASYVYDESKNIKVGEIGLKLDDSSGWTNCWSPRELYITSDEEIKEGDWHLVWLRGRWEIINYMPSTGYRKECLGKEVCKIILTTDPDLIKDGVQAINDEFLEWFVKNPSCEEVEVKPLLSNNGRALFGYKIIIPKEEPKQEFCNNCNNGICCCVVRKQETLEEAVELFFRKKMTKNRTLYKAAKFGANWQQERSYNEEDLREAYFQGWVTRERFDDLSPDIVYPKGLDYEEKQEYAFNLWFKQFKNK